MIFIDIKLTQELITFTLTRRPDEIDRCGSREEKNRCKVMP